MGQYWAHALPTYLAKWGVSYVLMPGWQTRSRSSGGFDNVMGVGIHHDAGGTSLTPRGAFEWACLNSPDRPIGNGTIGRNGSFYLWAAGATNTQGRGGPRWTSRGVIPLDNGNRNTFSIEAMNNGLGEPWSDAQCDAYVRVVTAVIDWANNETPGPLLTAGDVFAHFEWAPTRKVDPRGPSRWATGQLEQWDMDAFRGAVFQMLYPAQPDQPSLSEEDEEMNPIIVRQSDGATRAVGIDPMVAVFITAADKLRLLATGRFYEVVLDDATFNSIP